MFSPTLRITSKTIAWMRSDIEACQEQLAEKAA